MAWLSRNNWACSVMALRPYVQSPQKFVVLNEHCLVGVRLASVQYSQEARSGYSQIVALMGVWLLMRMSMHSQAHDRLQPVCR